MKIPEVIVKEFKRISFALAEDEALFEQLKSQSLEQFWQNIDSIVDKKGIYRTMESDHIAFFLDRLDQLLEESIEVIKRYEVGDEYRQDVNNNLQEKNLNSSENKSTTTPQTQQQAQQKDLNGKMQAESTFQVEEEGKSASNYVAVSKEQKDQADAQILKILQIESKLLKKEQYKFLYRQLDRILDILNWSDSLKIKRSALYILLLIVVIEEGSPKQELIYLKQQQIDQMSFFVRYYIHHINSFNDGYTELSGLFKFDDERFYKLEMIYNPKYKAAGILDFDKAQQIQKEINEQEGCNLIEQKLTTIGTSENSSLTEVEFEDATDLEQKLIKIFQDQQEQNWEELLNKAKHFEYIENSINTKPLNSLSIKPILQKLQGDKLITFELKYDESLTLYQNVKKIYHENIGKQLDDQICLFGGIKERLVILKNLKCRESRTEIAKMFLLSVQVLSFLMKVTKKHMQSIFTDQQLSFEKFQKSFPKQVTDLIHLNLDPKLHADVIKFMLVIIKEQSQLKRITEDYLTKFSDSLIIKIYTDCSNLELQEVREDNQFMEIENEKDKMIIENEDIRLRSNHQFKIVCKGQTVQETTLLNSKFIDYALTFVNTLLKNPENQGQSFQEVTPFSMNFVQIPFHKEYLTYNLKQIRKAIHSLSLMIQIEDIQREYKILYKILDKIEYYLDQKPKFQWVDGKWSPISQKQYDIFLGQLLRIVNQIFENSSKRSRRITPQLAKQLTECPKFFIILGNCIDRIIKGYSEQESFNLIPPNPTIVHEETEKILLIETVHLLSNINKENPNLIEKLLEEKIIQKSIKALQVLELPHDTKSISQIIYFLYHISLKEQGRSEIMESKLLQKIFDVFIDDNYAEEFYAYTLSSVIEAIQNYYNNIKEIVDIIYEKLNDLLTNLRKKCITYTNQIERYLNVQNSEENSNMNAEEDINFNYKNVICYQIYNVCKLIEKLITGIENVYPDTKNKYAGECLLNYLEILQFPFLFLIPQRTTHKTPFFSVKTTCKAIYNKLDPKNEVEKNKINKVLDINIQKIEELLGKKIEDVTSLNLELVNDLTSKNFIKLVKENKDVQYYKQIKLYQQLQFFDAMINTFRSLRITSQMINYQGFVQKISCLFPITFNQRFQEQFSFVKQRITYLQDQAYNLRKQLEQDNESLKHEQNNLENELKEFKLYFKENILSFKNHVNHYSYQNIIFYTILKLVYQNYSQVVELDYNSQTIQDNKQDVQRLITLTINSIDANLIDIKILEKYDMKTLEIFSSLAGSLVMLTQILQIFMKDSKLINYMILNNLQKQGSIAKVVEIARKFTEIWQQIELKSLVKSQKDSDELQNLSKESQTYYRKYQTLLSNSIDHCLETINFKLEYFFKMISLQIQFSLNFKKEQKEEYREDIRQGIYGWNYDQIKSQQQILKSIKFPSKNRYYSMLIEFLITHIELQILPRYQNTKKFIESEKYEKADQNQLSDDQYNSLSDTITDQPKEFFQFALKEFRRDKQLYGSNIDLNDFTGYILDNKDNLSKLYTSQGDIKNDPQSNNDQEQIEHFSKMKKEDFFAKVKSDAEEMCSYLLRELFCFKNHSDQILALLMRKELVDIDFIKTTILKIKDLQQQHEKKIAQSIEIGESKVSEDASRKSRRGQSVGLTQQRANDGGSASNNPAELGNDSPLFSLRPHSAVRNVPPAAPLNVSGSGRQEQSIGMFQMPQMISSTLNSQFDNQRQRNQFFESSISDALGRPRMQQNRQYLYGRSRQAMMENNQNANQQLSQGQKQEKDLQKIEQINQFKQQIAQWSDDYLVTQFQQVQASHNRISYVIFATLNLLISKIFKDFKFKNPFKGTKETIAKLRNNELLHVPSKLDTNSLYKLELINAIMPFAEKFGFYSYKEISSENQVTESSEKVSKTNQLDAQNTITQTNQPQTIIQATGNGEEPQNQSQNNKIFSLKLLNLDELEIKWKEGNESYQIGIEFIKMAKHLFTNGQNVFSSLKKGEDKENHKQTSFDAITFFIKNQCHLIQKVNSMNLKFKQNLKKDLEKAEQEELQVMKRNTQSQDKNTKDKKTQNKTQKPATAMKEDESQKMIAEENQENQENEKQQNQENKKRINKNKRKKNSKRNKKQKQTTKEATNDNQNTSSQKKQKIEKILDEEKSLQEKLKKLKESQTLINNYEKEVISMFVSLLHFSNEQYDYYNQSLINISILTFILDTIKQYSEQSKQYLNQFIQEKGIYELLKIRVQTDQIDLIIEKLNIFLTNITQDPTMALANYESKIKYFFYEKCIHQQTLMYQINIPYSRKQKRNKKDTNKKTTSEDSYLKKNSSTKLKFGKEESIFDNVNEQNMTDFNTSPPKQTSQATRKSVSPQKQQKAPSSYQQQNPLSLSQLLKSDLQQNQLPQQLPDKKMKKIKVSREEFWQRFEKFKSIPLFQEVLSKLCDQKSLNVKQKSSKSSNSNGSSKGKYFKLPKQNQRKQQQSQSDIFSNIYLSQQSQPNLTNQEDQSQNQIIQDAQTQPQQQNQSISSNNQQNQNTLNAPKDKKIQKSKSTNLSSKRKGKFTKSKKKVFVSKEFFILKDDIQLHKFQLIPKENFLSNLQNQTSIPLVSSNIIQSAKKNENNKKDMKQRSASASVSKYATKQSSTLFKQKSESKQPSIKSEQNLGDDIQGQANKSNLNQNNFDQMINFVAPTYIYETINQILESIVIQFTKKIIQNYDAIHKNQNNNKQSDQNDDYLFNNIILLKVIQIIARQQAILIPQIVRFRCSKIVKKIIQGHPLEPVFNKQLGNHFHFLKFITKCANYFSISQVKGLIFELCLDKQILYEHFQNNSGQQQNLGSHHQHKTTQNTHLHQQTQKQASKIISFGEEIRKKVLGEIYSSIESEMMNKQNILERPHTVHILISNILLHINLLNIREVAKLSLRNFSCDFTHLIDQYQSNQGIHSEFKHEKVENNENLQNDSNGYNFAKLYGDILKKFDISKLSQTCNVIAFVTSILEILYLLNYYFILYPSGISGNKNEGKKKNEDYMSKFIQSQILTQKFQNHIKQYAQHQGGVTNILINFPNDAIGIQRRPFNFQHGSESVLNQLNMFNRNIISFDPITALSRFTQGATNLLNPIGGNVSIRMTTDRDPSFIQDSFLSNNLRRSTAQNSLIFLSNQQRRQNNNELDSMFGQNQDGNNERNRDDEPDHLIMGRINGADDDDEDDDDEEEDEEEEEEEEDEDDEEEDEDDDHMGQQEESMEDEDEDEDDEDESENDEEDEEEEDDDESENDEEGDDDDDEEVDVDEEDLEDEDEDLEEEGGYEDEYDDNDYETYVYRQFRRGLRRDRRNLQNNDHSSQNNEFSENTNPNRSRRAGSQQNRNRLRSNANDENEPGSQQSMGNQQHDFVAEDQDISLGEEQNSNIGDDEEVEINQNNQAEEEELEEDDDAVEDQEGVAIYLDLSPEVSHQLEQNQIASHEDNLGEYNHEVHGEEEDDENEEDDDDENDIDDDEDDANRDGSYVNEDWENYSSGDEISDIDGQEDMSNDQFYEENSVEEEEDVRDREDASEDEENQEENQEEEEEIIHQDHADEEEEEEEEELISEGESNVWNDHEFSEDGSHIDGEESDENEDDEEEDEAFVEHPINIIEFDNLLNQVDGMDEEDDEEGEENEGEDGNDEDEEREDGLEEELENIEQNNYRQENADNAESRNRNQQGDFENIEQDNNENQDEEEIDEDDEDDMNHINQPANVRFMKNRKPHERESSNKNREKINEDPDFKKQQNTREVTEFTNINMSECIRDSYKRCQNSIHLHYIGTQQNIPNQTCFKEVQREVSFIEKQSEQSEGSEQALANTSPKKVGQQGDLTLEQNNRVFDKSVYVALLIYYRHFNFESAYNKISRSNSSQYHYMENQGNNPNSATNAQQELTNTQMVPSPYMANDRRSQTIAAHQSNATQYRLGLRIPHHMQMSSYNRHVHSRNQMQNRPVENQESEIPGSSLNELIQQVNNSSAQRNAQNSNLNNLNQLIRGSFSNIGGIPNITQLIRQNALFGNPNQIFNSSSLAGQRSLMQNLPPVLLDSGQLDIGTFNFQMRNHISQISQPSSNQLRQMQPALSQNPVLSHRPLSPLNPTQHLDILINATTSMSVEQSVNNNSNNNQSENQGPSQELQQPQQNDVQISQNVEQAQNIIDSSQPESQPQIPPQNVSEQQSQRIQTEEADNLSQMLSIANNYLPTQNSESTNQEDINQIVNEITQIAPLFQATLNQTQRSSSDRSSSQRSENIQGEPNLSSNQQNSQSARNNENNTTSNNDQVASLVNELSSIAPLLIPLFDSSSSQQRNNPTNSSSNQDNRQQPSTLSQNSNNQRSQNTNIQQQNSQNSQQDEQPRSTPSQQEPQTSSEVLASNQAVQQIQQQQQQNQRSSSSNNQSYPNLSQNSIMVLSRFNFDASFLTRHGLDFQIFDELPDDIKEEMVISYLQYPDNEPSVSQQNTDQQNNTTQQTSASQNQNTVVSSSGGDNSSDIRNTITNNDQPTSVSNVVNQQQSQSQSQENTRNVNQPSNNQQENQIIQVNQANVDFVNQADINLRMEILLQSEENFLRTLTPEMQEEARRYRENNGQINRNQFFEFRTAPRQQPNQSPQQSSQIVNQMVNQIFNSNNYKSQKKQSRLIDDWIYKDQFIYKKLIETDDKFIESILRLIYYGGKQQFQFPIQLLELICKNPNVEQKVFDSLMFILMNPNMQEIKQAYKKENNESVMVDEQKKDEEDVFDFPLLYTYHKNSKETDYKKVYLDVSLRILKIIQKLTLKRVLFFIDTEKVQKDNVLDIRPLIQIEKDKGNLGCVRELKKFAEEINSQIYDQKSFSLPYFQFIYLLTQDPFRNNYDHLYFLLSSVQNITKKLFQYHSGKQEIEEETISSIHAQLGSLVGNSRNAQGSGRNETQNQDNQAQHSIFAKDNSFQLHPDVIRWICSIFSSECLNETLIKKLSLIINQLCYDKTNLDMFITELRNIIKLFSIQINKQVVKCLQSIKSLDRNSPSFSSQFKIHLSQIEFQISGEKKIQKIFQIIYELFEKSLCQVEEESKLKENSQKNKSASKNDLNAPNQPNNADNQMEQEEDEEEEEKKQDTTSTNNNNNLNAHTYGVNRRTSVSQTFEVPQHRNRGTSVISNSGDPKSSVKKLNSKQQLKEQERLENIKKEIRSKFSEIISHQNFNELWINCAELFSLLGKYEPQNLSSYNTAIEKLQPIMESYFIIFRIMHDEDFEFLLKSQSQKKQQQQKQQQKQISSLADDETVGNTEELSSLDFDSLKENIKEFDIQQIFKFICEQCKVVINQMVRQNLKQKKSQTNKKSNDVLQKDPFEIIFKRHPYLIDFENKKNYFKQEMQNLKLSIHTSQKRKRIKVRRNHVFEDSFQQIDSMKPEELKHKFIIEFDQEEGIDAGGLLREWFILLSKAIFNPDYLLFKPSSTGNTYQPNKNSYFNDNHLQYFKFVGKVVGKALFEGQLLDAYFTRSFYKHILGQPLTYHDIEDQDYQFYQSLKWIMENDISIIGDEMTFCYEECVFDNKQIIDLKPDGQHIKVTEDNKQEYVKLICYAKMAKDIKAQIEYFLEGFHELIPYDLVKIFDSHELELMISGLPDIDIQDLKENTEYQNYTQNSKVIEWFWQIMEEFDNSARASFLQFVTGTSKVPVEGFKGLRGISGLQKFQIHKAYDPKKLPIAHTCFNQLDIPEYPSKEILKKKLLLAISEGKEGFGFA
ncbi:HECT domain ubiquitin transferase (macronuclear) [Tetrahymena thermophila SB210]|uniref:HECT-type E3 ubiquitin transferase n=1 Tax=Tetrahymena thermophila (strain SB210) TaxID=312017 RepID=I7LVX1_TETTS|nr:HECT domain ubiquitin transferase [Tetrahymena thermophila SB210]EAS00266.2 HECT domain ubiquitin transferase [Tetrahymena thermophila SB210]|eukprot:XP_001020511.2 HECT domain ubiquitin transferase [Tetrahymena thermophila SB210]